MSLREVIREAIACKAMYISHYDKTVAVQRSVNKTANLWYRTHYPEKRVMCPALDQYRTFTLKELNET